MVQLNKNTIAYSGLTKNNLAAQKAKTTVKTEKVETVSKGTEAPSSTGVNITYAAANPSYTPTGNVPTTVLLTAPPKDKIEPKTTPAGTPVETTQTTPGGVDAATTPEAPEVSAMMSQLLQMIIERCDLRARPLFSIGDAIEELDRLRDIYNDMYITINDLFNQRDQKKEELTKLNADYAKASKADKNNLMVQMLAKRAEIQMINQEIQAYRDARKICKQLREDIKKSWHLS